MLTTEKEGLRRTRTRQDDRTVKAAPDPAQDVDFSLFGAKEIRDVLKNKAHCLHAGFPPDHIIIETLNEIRDHYVRRVGLPTYLSQMLGELATAPVRNCALYTEEGHRIEIHVNGNHSQPVQRFIAKQFRSDNLPFKVEIHRESTPDRVEIRYL